VPDDLQAALDAAEASLRQARAQGAVQGNQASYTRLQADAAGVVVGVEAEVGQVVAAGTPIVRVARHGARDVVFSVPEDRLASVKPGTRAQVRLWSAAQGGPLAAPLTGTVREVAASADPLTRTYLVKLGLPAEADIPLGATAYVSLATAAGHTAIALPTSALMRAADGGTAVWVFDPSSSTVQPRTVQLAGADGNAMLVASGLKPGEEVVAAGVHVLAAGQKVTRFVDMAETFHLPVVNLVDIPGFLIGLEAEQAATIRHGSRALSAIYQATVPWCSVLVRKTFGVAGAAHCNASRLRYRYAWPSGDWGSIPLEGGVEAAYRADFAAAPDPQAALAEITARLEALRSPFRTAEAFGVEEIIDPRQTRPLLCEFAEHAYRLLRPVPTRVQFRP